MSNGYVGKRKQKVNRNSISLLLCASRTSSTARCQCLPLSFCVMSHCHPHSHHDNQTAVSRSRAEFVVIPSLTDSEARFTGSHRGSGSTNPEHDSASCHVVTMMQETEKEIVLHGPEVSAPQDSSRTFTSLHGEHHSRSVPLVTPRNRVGCRVRCRDRQGRRG